MAKRGRPTIARPRVARFEVRCRPEMHALVVLVAGLYTGQTLAGLWHQLVLEDARQWLLVGVLTASERARLERALAKAVAK